MSQYAPMEPGAKTALNQIVRALRERLIADLRATAVGTYRLSVGAAQAGLDEGLAIRRGRLARWLDEQVRTAPAAERKTGLAVVRERFLMLAVKEAAATLLNRLVVLRQMEALGLTALPVVTGGRKSTGHRQLREHAPALCDDETEGYATLLRLVFEDLAVDLPGVFGDVGLTSLFPIPPATLLAAVDAVNDPRLASCWTDDTTLGWVYQYWNDPEREALDRKIADGGKVAPHEIASKTQMFTERYMVEWLLQNSLHPLWLAMCRAHGWTPEVEATGTLAALDARRADWQARRERGEVALDALMPVAEGLEDRWKYYVPQPEWCESPTADKAEVEEVVERWAPPDSVRDLKLLDPACGSGHFLVIAFDLLAALYEEEARHRGEIWSARAIGASIVADNLRGLDIDPRAVQIAAAALWLKLRSFAPDARPTRWNLVASDLRIASLADDDPALVTLRKEVRETTGIPESLTNEIVAALKGADHLGSLLKVDTVVEQAIQAHERGETTIRAAVQPDLFGGRPTTVSREGTAEMFRGRTAIVDELRARQRASVLDGLETFLAKHDGGDDLGLRLEAEQLARGVRFVRLVREGQYHLVVGNPPYQGTSKMVDAAYVATHYPRGKADLYAAFLERGLQLARPGGVSALLTMRNWMFIQQYAALREWLLATFDLRALGDFAVGAFDDVPNDLLSVVVSVFRRSAPAAMPSVALQPTPPDVSEYDRERTKRKRAAVLAGEGLHVFDMGELWAVERHPLLYWWSPSRFATYKAYPLVGNVAPARFGLTTGDNERFAIRPWEVRAHHRVSSTWMPVVFGAKGLRWFEPLLWMMRWAMRGLEVKIKCEVQYGSVSKQIRNEELYFGPGIAFSPIGSDFGARTHRYPSVFTNTGLSLFPDPSLRTRVLVSMNTTVAAETMNDLAPGLRFDVGDVNRLPLFPVESADEICATLDRAFTAHEQARETSVEFRRPGPSPWRYAQDWAQRAVDRAPGAPLPPYAPEYDPPPPERFVSFALGVVLGRFGAEGEGLLDQPPAGELPDGVLYLSSSDPERDDLAHPACAPLRAAWAEHGPAVAPGRDLRTWLRESFFADVHRKQYESRPIWWPLSSERRSFVAWVAIHRMDERTLTAVQARLLRDRSALQGRLDDLRTARLGADRKAAAQAEKRFAQLQRLHEELCAFLETLTACAEQGPPPAQPGGLKREVDARYAPDLDDGVMVNSAALWPLLEPQWKDPRKWWKELAAPAGRKDYDWSHLAMRYFPTRVDGKCREDPSLGVAHGCFWKYHPARAYAWELRLQDEIAPDFTIDEPGSDAAREAFLRDSPDEALAIREKEKKRRERKANKADEQELGLDAAGDEGSQEDVDADAPVEEA